MTAATTRGSRMLGLLLAGALVAATAPPASPPAAAAATAPLALPLKEGSLRFAVIGDSGTGSGAQYELARLLAEWRADFPFELVLMIGDNIYGRDDPRDYRQKFEEPYRALLDAGVKFYAALGNHDDPNAALLQAVQHGGRALLHVQGAPGGVRFFALDSNYMDKPAARVAGEGARRRRARTGRSASSITRSTPRARSTARTRSCARRSSPLFVKHGVDVVLTGHEHFYERIKPQNGIHYFISGAAGQLRGANIAQLRDRPHMASTRTSASCSWRSRATSSTSRP